MSPLSKQVEQDMMRFVENLMKHENLTEGEAFVVQGFVMARLSHNAKNAKVALDCVLNLVESLCLSKEKVDILKGVSEKLLAQSNAIQKAKGV